MEWFDSLTRRTSKKHTCTNTTLTAAFNNRYEQAACRYLLDQGLVLIEANYRCRTGEIDLIMQHKEVLVFIEVRYRKNPAYGSAVDSITKAKQKKIIKAANHYLQRRQRHYSSHINCRFDVIGVSPSQHAYTTTPDLSFNWLQAAFCT